MPKKLVLVALVALLLGGGLWWYLQSRESGDKRLVLYGNVDIRQVSLAFTGSEPWRMSTLP